ncbi:MAG: UDP-3-O-acyl-N-acetylglucosamine deacetylase [Desulfobacteraceae bacterium]|nr:UDP-3-O-acyl-N-acetylglucosamine deacetylase [Desulfobacteraceae bacterium]
MSSLDPHQHTIKKPVSMRGIGLHSGRAVNLTIKPAEVDTGIRFVRSDVAAPAIPASMRLVVDTRLATTIARDETAVATTEHLLAALSGMNIDNALIELDGPEVPIMDGSAGPFVHLLRKADRRRQKGVRRVLRITDEIAVRDGGKEIRVLPGDGLKITCEIDFDHELIRRQRFSIELSPRKFAAEIAMARTFGFMEDVEKLQENGFALGGSLENAVVMDQGGVLNPEGLRFRDEFVRHKILDIVGDLALLGCPVLGHVIASRSGHRQHLLLMQEIARRPECWELVELESRGATRRGQEAASPASLLMPILAPSSLAGDSCPA